MKKDVTLVKKVKRLLNQIGCPRWLHHLGPKKYEFFEHMLALFFRQACKLSFRRVSKLLRGLGFEVPTYSALAKMQKRIPLWIWRKLLAMTTRFKNIVLAAIDSTTLGRTNPSWHYIKRIGRKKPVNHPVKLSALLDTRRKKFLALRLRSKPTHDVKDFKYLFRNTNSRMKKVVGDSAYDAEFIHEFAHELGVINVIKPKKNVKRGFHRRKMRKHFNRRVYNRREMIESGFGGLKQKYGANVLERTIRSQRAEVYCRFILHNLSLMK